MTFEVEKVALGEDGVNGENVSLEDGAVTVQVDPGQKVRLTLNLKFSDIEANKDGAVMVKNIELIQGTKDGSGFSLEGQFKVHLRSLRKKILIILI